MKKSIIITVCVSLIFICKFSIAQLSANTWQFIPATIPSDLKQKTSLLHDSYFDVNAATPPPPVFSPDSNNSNDGIAEVAGFTSTVIGTTYLDIQTNASVSNNLFRDNDGTLYAAWNFAPVNDPLYLLRGTGYNKSDGTNWLAPPASRIETTQNGWPSVTRTKTGDVLVLTHNLEYAQLQLSQLINPITNTWSEHLNVLPTTATGGVWWPRMVRGGSDNSSLHVIALTLPMSRGGALYNSQDGALLYSRSEDNGQTWDVINTTIPLIGPGEYYRIREDNYAIDANGNTVAIAVGGIGNDLLLLKSIDNGNNWTSHVIMKFPIPHFNDQISDTSGDGEADTLQTNDGSLAVLIDNGGNVHVWAGYVRMYNDDSTDHTLSYVPTSNGIFYYNETMGDTPPRMITGALDLNGNGKLDITSFGTFNAGLATHPNAAVDVDGNIYFSYSAVVENDPDASGKDVRHTYLMSSRDGGANWSYPMDVVFPFNNEGIYGCLAHRIDHTVQLIYQRDACAGISTTYGFPDPCNTGMQNKIMYSEIPADQVLAVHDPSLTGQSHIYPNPSNGIIHADLLLQHQEQAIMTVFDLEGKEMLHRNTTIGNSNSFDLTDLNDGIYLLNIRNDQLNLMQKIVMVK